jgi:hypothetical protein
MNHVEIMEGIQALYASTISSQVTWSYLSTTEPSASPLRIRIILSGQPFFLKAVVNQ